jgi:hypothetical protein
MSRITDRAIRKYQASVTSEAVKAGIRRAQHFGIPQSAADIRAAAAMTLRDVLDAEIAR